MWAYRVDQCHSIACIHNLLRLQLYCMLLCCVKQLCQGSAWLGPGFAALPYEASPILRAAAFRCSQTLPKLWCAAMAAHTHLLGQKA
jgi:hypothetical protein